MHWLPKSYPHVYTINKRKKRACRIHVLNKHLNILKNIIFFKYNDQSTLGIIFITLLLQFLTTSSLKNHPKMSGFLISNISLLNNHHPPTSIYDFTRFDIIDFRKNPS